MKKLLQHQQQYRPIYRDILAGFSSLKFDYSGGVTIFYGDTEDVNSERECRKVIEDGKILVEWNHEGDDISSRGMRVLHYGYVYNILARHNFHTCYWKRKFHDK